MKNIQLVIPAAGLGSRFANNGFLKPKPLIDVAGLPMILWVLGNFDLQRGDSVIIVSRVGLELEMEIQDVTRSLGLNLKFVQVPALTEGPAITAQHAKQLLDLDLPLIIANSDQFVSQSFIDFTDRLREEKDDLGLILTMTASSPKWSYVGRSKDGYVDHIAEKVEISNEATVGIYGWSSARLFFNSLAQMIASNDRTNGEFYVAPTYNYLISGNVNVSTYHVGQVEKSVHGLGTVEDLLKFLNNPSLPLFIDRTRTALGFDGK